MLRRRSALVSAAGALLLLASLYMPWWTVGCADQFACRPGTDPWSAPGELAGLAAVAAVVAAALDRGDWTVVAAAIAAYFALVDWIWTRVQLANNPGFDKTHLATGGYLGIAAVVLLAAGALAGVGGPWPGRRAAVGTGLAAGLLVVQALPWWGSSLGLLGHGFHVDLPGVALSTATAAAALAVWAALLWWRWDPAGASYRLEVSVLILVLVGGAVATAGSPFPARLGTVWVALGLASALVAAALPAVLPSPSWPALATGAATALFVTGLFLPWRQACESGPRSLRCVSTDGWGVHTTIAAVLAMALVLVALETGAFAALAAEGGIAIALLMSVSGFATANDGLAVRFGVWFAFAGAAAVVAVSLLSVRVRWPGERRALELVAPVAGCLSYLFILVVPSLEVLSEGVHDALFFSSFVSLLSIAGALLAILLLGRWLRGYSAGLVAIPLAMLTLAALQLIRFREFGMTWGRGAVIGLSLALAGLGWIQQRGLPEALHVERIEVGEP
jgi:hypothetical protein